MILRLKRAITFRNIDSATTQVTRYYLFFVLNQTRKCVLVYNIHRYRCNFIVPCYKFMPNRTDSNNII
jgi:hypothetical protein